MNKLNHTMKYFQDYWAEESPDKTKTMREHLTPVEMCFAKMLDNLISRDEQQRKQESKVQ